MDTSIIENQSLESFSTKCKSLADCFRGKVTEIVDGDTLDVNNVRVRLARVNTPETDEEGYNEAIEATKSESDVFQFIESF